VTTFPSPREGGGKKITGPDSILLLERRKRMRCLESHFTYGGERGEGPHENFFLARHKVMPGKKK